MPWEALPFKPGAVSLEGGEVCPSLQAASMPQVPAAPDSVMPGFRPAVPYTGGVPFA